MECRKNNETVHERKLDETDMNDLTKKAMRYIPSQLHDSRFRFVPIRFAEKRPFGSKWNTTTNYTYDDPTLAKFLLSGHNYGICTGVGGLVVFDSDEEQRLQELGVCDHLPDTFSVRTGGGGVHRYYSCSDIGDKIVMYDLELVDEHGESLHLGEVLTSGFQAVCPWSVHPNGNRYRVIDKRPIVEIEWDNLYDMIRKKTKTSIGVTKSNKPFVRAQRDPGFDDPFEHVRVENVLRPTNVVKNNNGVLMGSHPVHGSSTGSNFKIDTNRNTWHCFRCNSGGGPALAIAVKEHLLRCDEARKGILRGKLYIDLVKIAQEHGYIDKPKRLTVRRIA